MLIAVSGSQGSGKTTLLNELKKRGNNIIERKTSRSILSDWGVTLQQVNNDHDLTIKFQEEILSRKYYDERGPDLSREVWFTERSYADLFTYALVSLGKDNSYSDWLSDYYRRCAKLQKMYGSVIYLQGGLFAVEHDGVRGSNPHYSRMVDLVMEDISCKMTAPLPLVVLAMPDIGERIKQIEWVVEECKMAYKLK